MANANTVLYYELPTHTDGNRWDFSFNNWQIKGSQLDHIISLTESMKKGMSEVTAAYPGIDLKLRLIGHNEDTVRYQAIIDGKNDAEYESALAAFIRVGMEKGFAPNLADGDKQPLEKILNTYNLTQKSNFPYIGKEFGRSVVKLNRK
jgi:hypothetical protein